VAVSESSITSATLQHHVHHVRHNLQPTTHPTSRHAANNTTQHPTPHHKMQRNTVQRNATTKQTTWPQTVHIGGRWSVVVVGGFAKSKVAKSRTNASLLIGSCKQTSITITTDADQQPRTASRHCDTVERSDEMKMWNVKSYFKSWKSSNCERPNHHLYCTKTEN